jgi:hypothetical protein
MNSQILAQASTGIVRRLLAIDAAIVAALALHEEPISSHAVASFVERHLSWARRGTVYDRLDRLVKAGRVDVRRYEGRVYPLHSLPNPPTLSQPGEPHE